MCTTCITLDYLFRIKQKSLWYFQLKVDCYSNKINKNKYKNFQLIASTKINFKTAKEQITQGVYLYRQLLIPCCFN